MSRAEIRAASATIDRILSLSLARSVRDGCSRCTATVPADTLVSPGEEVQVWIDGERQLTGWVVGMGIDAQARTLELDIRSRTYLLMVRSVGEVGRWRGHSAAEIVRQVCVLAGASVDWRAPEGDPVSLDCQPEATCWEVISRALGGRALAVTDTPRGELLVSDPQYESPGDAITDRDLEALRWRVDISRRRSTYTLRHYRWTDSPLTSRMTDAWMDDLGWDEVIRSPRRVTQREAEALLQTEALRRAGESITYSVTAHGLRWAPGQWLRLTSDALGLSEEVVALDVTWSLGDGTRTVATLGYLEALGRLQRPSAHAGRGRKRGLLDVGL